MGYLLFLWLIAGMVLGRAGNPVRMTLRVTDVFAGSIIDVTGYTNAGNRSGNDVLGFKLDNFNLQHISMFSFLKILYDRRKWF